MHPIDSLGRPAILIGTAMAAAWQLYRLARSALRRRRARQRFDTFTMGPVSHLRVDTKAADRG